MPLLVLLPAGLTFAGGGAAAWATWHWGRELVARFSEGHGAWLGWLLYIVLVVVVAVAAYVAYLCVGMVATAPFADTLAERAEALAGGAPPAARSFSRAVADGVRNLAHTVMTLVLYLALAVPLFLLQLFVSPLAPVVAVVGLFVTATFLSYDLFEPSLARRGRSFGEKWAFLRAHRAETLGLGMASALASAVPLFGILILPCATVAAGLLFVELEKKP